MKKLELNHQMRFNKLLIVFAFFLLVGLTGLAGFFALKRSVSSFESLTAGEMYERIVEERDFAIQKAVEAGVYSCCITPPCTMCYWEGNQWNNNQAGTCACDDLIAQGKEPCPQCERGLCSEEGTCKVGND